MTAVESLTRGLCDMLKNATVRNFAQKVHDPETPCGQVGWGVQSSHLNLSKPMEYLTRMMNGRS
jgi:hypothetical protein